MLCWRLGVWQLAIQGWRSKVLADGRCCGLRRNRDLIRFLAASDTPAQTGPAKLHLHAYKSMPQLCMWQMRQNRGKSYRVASIPA